MQFDCPNLHLVCVDRNHLIPWFPNTKEIYIHREIATGFHLPFSCLDTCAFIFAELITKMGCASLQRFASIPSIRRASDSSSRCPVCPHLVERSTGPSSLPRRWIWISDTLVELNSLLIQHCLKCQGESSMRVRRWERDALPAIPFVRSWQKLVMLEIDRMHFEFISVCKLLLSWLMSIWCILGGQIIDPSAKTL